MTQEKRMCPDCGEQPLPPDYRGFAALRCDNCALARIVHQPAYVWFERQRANAKKRGGGW